MAHMSEPLDFLGFRTQWCRKRGTSKWYVYTLIADRPIRSLKDKIRALTRRTSQQPPRAALIRLNQIMRGWPATSSTRSANTPSAPRKTSHGTG
jgi:RNA-directed DNA polymerase